jgi:glutathione S-transferase
MYKLYYAPGACSLAVHIALEWISHPYEAIKSNPGSSEYLKINPAGAVPALDIGTDTPLTQNAAILHFLARRFPEAELDAGSNLERTAEMERWASFLTGDLHPAFFPVFMAQRYTTATDEASLAHVREAAVALVGKKLSLLDKQLEGRKYVLGSKRTFVDAYSVPMIRWAVSTIPGGLTDYPDVKRHHEHMLADPAVQRAMRDEGLIKD